jgi:outer membrane protein assembly factor BamE
LSPYKIDVQQGNAITQEMMDKLKPGMTPSQVRFILGSPLVRDPFHPHRWDYVYSYAKAGRMTEQRRITVVFEDDKLKGIEGDVVSTDQPADKKPEGGKP